MSERFADRVVIVTGGAGDIGLATARRFAEEGAAVALVGLDDEHLRRAEAALGADHDRVVAIGADVTSAADVERYVAETVSAFGRLDVLINNAGIEGAMAPVTEYPDDVFDQVIAVNLRGVYLGLKYAARQIARDGGGAIVNMASVAGTTGTPGLIAYGASKHAVLGMTKTAAVELAPAGIRVNAVCPGPIEGRMMDSIGEQAAPGAAEQVREGYAAQIPLGRYGRPEEVAALCAFLASDDAAYLNGGAYLVDGGMVAS